MFDLNLAIGSEVFKILSAAIFPRRIITLGEIRLICLSRKCAQDDISVLLGFLFSGGRHFTVLVM